ncbi:alkyl sulfatase dimerization domain-containing protein [Alkalibacterium indicireducens]
MNLGYAVDEVIKNVKLPSHLQSLPYMEEFYGTVEWSIKSIYSAYLGWFDGNPTNTNKLSKEKYSEKLLSLIENKEKIMSEIVNDNDKEDLLWAMELCDLLLNSKSNNQKEINILKAKIMLKVADYETSANSRHYYIEYAKEILKNEKEIGGNSNGL